MKTSARKFASSKSIPMKRRRLGRVTSEIEEKYEYKIQKEGDNNSDDHDYLEIKTDTTDLSSSFIFPQQSNSISIPANLKESARSKIGVGTVVANTNDHSSGGEIQSRVFEMEDICSIAFFRATPLTEFRRKLTDCLKQNVLCSSRVVMASSDLSSDSDNNDPLEFVRFDRLEVSRRFSNDIDWKSLCRHHDQSEYKRRNISSNTSKTTILSEIVLAVTNPVVIPRCCHNNCVIDILLNALLASPSLSISLNQRQKKHHQQHTFAADATTMTSGWTPSQQLLLATIQKLLTSERIPPDSSMTNYVRDFFLSHPFPTKGKMAMESEVILTGTTNTTVMTPNKVNRLLSAIYWLLSSSLSSISSLFLLLERDLISSGLLLLQCIDSWDVQIDLESKYAYDQRFFCEECNGDLRKNGWLPRINRRVTVETLSNLHDEALNFENNTTSKVRIDSKTTQYSGYGYCEKQMSLKDILAFKQNKNSNNNCTYSGATRTCRCIDKKSGEQMKRKLKGTAKSTTISIDWSKVRSRAYKKFVSYSVERRQQQCVQEVPSYNIMMQLVNDAAMHLESPSRRVCLALLAHSAGGPKNPTFFKNVARLFWQGYALSVGHGGSTSSQWLRCYSEWLSECAVFDQRMVVWEAILPMIQHINKCIASNQQQQHRLNVAGCVFSTQKLAKSDSHNCNHNIEAPMMACLAFVLTNCYHLFQIHRRNEENIHNDDGNHIPEVDAENEFQSFINLVSIYCGEYPDIWLSLFHGSTRDLVESTLQRLGILSISVSNWREEPDTHTVTNGIKSTDAPMHTGATSNWPFAEEFSLRKAMERIDVSVMSFESRNDAVNTILASPISRYRAINEKTKKARRSKTPIASTPISDYLHDSGILCLIFSFCGPKRLSKISQVCKAWKIVSDTVSNTLWEHAYVKRFGKYRWPCLDAERRHLIATGAIEVNDSCCLSEYQNQTYWKTIFVEKEIVDKMVRFQRNPKSGYKYRTCNYVGCLQILKTAEQERKHDKMHRRLLSNQRLASEKKSMSKKNHRDTRN